MLKTYAVNKFKNSKKGTVQPLKLNQQIDIFRQGLNANQIVAIFCSRCVIRETADIRPTFFNVFSDISGRYPKAGFGL